LLKLATGMAGSLASALGFFLGEAIGTPCESVRQL
jgi:hypothetical protein